MISDTFEKSNHHTSALIWNYEVAEYNMHTFFNHTWLSIQHNIHTLAPSRASLILIPLSYFEKIIACLLNGKTPASQCIKSK